MTTRRLFSVFLLMFTFKLAISNILFPPEWDEVCTANITLYNISKHVSMTCQLSGSEQVHITLKDLIPFTQNQTDDTTYGVDFICSSAGNLTMVWPMKIDKLIDLRVKGCSIHDFFNDWNNSALDNTSDSLQYLSLIDYTLIVDPLVLLASLSNVANTSHEWTCHHDRTLRKMVHRNKSTVFEIPKEMFTAGMLASLDQVDLINDILDNKPVCKYLHLEELEQTYEKTMAVYHFTVLGEKAEFPKLKYINYSHDGWTEIPEVLQDWRLRFRHLEYLDLRFNRITEVNMKNRFDGITGNDTIIDVRNNNITTLTTKDLRNWAKLLGMFIDIRNNPLHCGCLKQDFILQVQEEDFFKEDLSKYEYIREMTCATPDSARGQTLSSVSKADMGCVIPPADLTVALYVVAVVAVVIVICIVVAVKYRKEVKIILYTRFGVLFPWDVDDKKENKRYDAFVSYSSDDEDWVYKNLQPLEEPTAEGVSTFTLCLHQRDFIGGISILDNIIDSIENSRHSIVILSDNFIRSIWGMEEFRQAYYQSIVRKHRHLIIVKYGDVNEDKLDPMLKRCLKTFTYLDVKDNMFMDRLKFALAVKTRPSKGAPNNLKNPLPDVEQVILERTDSVKMNPVAINTQISNHSDDSGCDVDLADKSVEFNDNDNQLYEETV